MHSKFALTGLVAAILWLAACTTSPIPQAAIDVINAYWQSLPGSSTHKLTVIRAWPGKPLSNDTIELPPSLEVWCVDTEITPKNDPSSRPESMAWIVTRSGKDAEWQSSPLMVLSSTWPYEACLGKVP